MTASMSSRQNKIGLDHLALTAGWCAGNPPFFEVAPRAESGHRRRHSSDWLMLLRRC